MGEVSEAWERDCMHWQGRVLTGRYAHYCGAFDDLPVDETCDEFRWCDCEIEDAPVRDEVVYGGAVNACAWARNTRLHKRPEKAQVIHR